MFWHDRGASVQSLVGFNRVRPRGILHRKPVHPLAGSIHDQSFWVLPCPKRIDMDLSFWFSHDPLSPV